MKLIENSDKRVVLEAELPRSVYLGWAFSAVLTLLALIVVLGVLDRVGNFWLGVAVVPLALIATALPPLIAKRRKRVELDRDEKRLTYEEWTLLRHDQRKGRVHDVTYLSTGRVSENPRLKLKHDEWTLGLRVNRTGPELMNALRPLRDALREAGARI